MKYLIWIKRHFTAICSARQAFLRTVFIFLTMPTATWAGMKLDKAVVFDNILLFKVIALTVASLCGGISSTFVKTSFDDGIKHPNIFKVFVGTLLGTGSGLLVLDNFNFGIFSIFLPTYIIASLGAPIMVFYLMWLSKPETQAEIKEQIARKVREKLNIGENK